MTRRLKGVHMAEYGGYESYISYPKQLPTELRLEQAAAIRIFMDDKLVRKPAMTLRLRIDGLTPPDQFAVALNGRRLNDLVRLPNKGDVGARYYPSGSYEGGQGAETQWVECSIPNLKWMQEGANIVEVALQRRNEGIASRLVLSNVEFDVKYV